MDKFEVPVVPAIYVPRNVSLNQNKSETPITPKVSKVYSEVTSSAENIPNDANSNSDIQQQQHSQICSSCSHILLSYFEPLQQYINEVVDIAKGHQNNAPQPLKLPNLENTGTHLTDGKIIDSNYEQNKAEIQINGPNHEQKYVNQTQQHSKDHYYASNSRSEAEQHRNNSDRLDKESNYHYNSIDKTQKFDESGTNLRTQHQGVSDQNRSDKIETNEKVVQSNAKHASSRKDKTQSSQIQKNKEQSATKQSQHEAKVENVSTVKNVDEIKNVDIGQNDSYRNDLTYDNDNASQISDNKPNLIQDSGQQSSSTINDNKRETSNLYDNSYSSPFAFVTIAYNNLSAANAIILANSLLLTNNKSMNYSDEYGNKYLIQIPFVILLGGSIDPSLKDAIFMVFDEVVSQPMDVKVALLSDHSFGIQQFKVQLWKELINYKKCIYLESSTMAIAKVTNLFQECEELSACVDWIFPDNFNCSVFVFEPSMKTYDEIINFALLDQKIKSASQRDDGMNETIDEMTLLNQFFAPKWKRISFIYNFVRNDAIYTQLPAFMKFGDSIKIVNFGHLHISHVNLGNQSGISATQPWNLMIDLLTSSQSDVITNSSFDNYSKFYLNIFIKRVWPLLQSHLTPLLISKYGVGRREWSIFELVRLLSNQSGLETDDHMFTQNPITLRRIKSATDMTQLENIRIEDEQIETNIDSCDNSDTIISSEADDQEFDEQSDTIQDTILEETLTSQELDERSMREFEAGRIDWMGAHKSDKIIQRLKNIIKND